MGYQSAAFVFGGAPEWQRLEGVRPDLALSGFQHAETGLAVLFARPVGEDEDRYPFTRLFERPDLEPPLLDAGNEALARAASAAAGLLTDEWYGTSVVRPALNAAFALHQALGQPMLYIAANDEGLNLGVLVEQGRLAKFVFHGEEGYAELIDGTIVLQPVEIDGEECYLDLDEVAEELGELRALEVRPPIVSEDDDWRYMHSAPIKVWPHDWPSPAAVLGLGTWDAWLEFDSAFASVYQRR